MSTRPGSHLWPGRLQRPLSRTVRLRPIVTVALGRSKGADFARNVLLVSSGAVVGRVIGLLAAPALRRFYTPVECGVMGVCVSVIVILTVAAMPRYEAAIPSSETDSEALNVPTLSCPIGVVSSLVCAGFAHDCPL
jgi:O-antigen/teichoic acid export membrane protein